MAPHKPVLLELRKGFGQRLRALPDERGLSQEAFAEQAGVHRICVDSAERGDRDVALDHINASAHALGVIPSRLVDD